MVGQRLRFCPTYELAARRSASAGADGGNGGADPSARQSAAQLPLEPTPGESGPVPNVGQGAAELTLQPTLETVVQHRTYLCKTVR
jgi:hypothetical protein